MEYAGLRVLLISDGTPQGTRLEDADTGERIPLPLTSVEWHIACDGEACLRLTVPAGEIQAYSDLVVVLEGPSV